MLAYATTIATNGIIMPWTSLFTKQFGTKATVFLSGSLVSLAYIAAGLATTLLELVLGYGVILGLGLGLASSAPSLCVIKWMPKHKSLITGVVFSSIGLGACLYGILANWLCNPLSLNADSGSYFSIQSGVPEAVPYMCFILGCVFFSVTALSTFLIVDCPDKFPSSSNFEMSELNYVSIEEVASISYDTYAEVESKNEPQSIAKRQSEPHLCHLDLTPTEMYASPLAWHMASGFVMVTVPLVYFLGTYKSYGAQYISNQAFLTQVAGLCNIFNSFGRIVWGEIAEIFGPVQTLKFDAAISAIILGTYYWATSSGDETLYMIYTFCIQFCMSGNFTLLLPIIM
jgi:nitrate/nitrite transporter NarK